MLVRPPNIEPIDLAQLFRRFNRDTYRLRFVLVDVHGFHHRPPRSSRPSAFPNVSSHVMQSGPPPSGSSLGLYPAIPGELGKLEDGKTIEIELSVDDSVKMP